MMSGVVWTPVCVDGGRMGDSVPHRQPHPFRRRHVLRHLRIRWEAAVGRSTWRRRGWQSSASQEPTTAAATTTVATSGGRSDCAPSWDVVVRRDDSAWWTLPDQDGDGADTDCATWWHLSERLCQRTQPVAIDRAEWLMTARTRACRCVCVRVALSSYILTVSRERATYRPASRHRHSAALVSRHHERFMVRFDMTDDQMSTRST